VKAASPCSQLQNSWLWSHFLRLSVSKTWQQALPVMWLPPDPRSRGEPTRIRLHRKISPLRSIFQVGVSLSRSTWEGVTQTSPVEVLGGYSNHADQGERLAKLLENPRLGPRRPETRTPKQLQHRLAQPEADQLITAYLAGESVYDLSDRYGVHRNTVSRILERHGIDRRYRLLRGDMLDEAIEQYRQGASLRTVGQQLGVSLDTVRNALIRSGVELRPRPGWEY
jgi:lambda repressor-like predicted transcriptional regulator